MAPRPCTAGACPRHAAAPLLLPLMMLALLPPHAAPYAAGTSGELPEQYGWEALRSVMSVAVPPHGLGPDFSSEVTVVTAYFQLTKSKFTHTRYQGWLRTMLAHVSNPMVVFTTPSDEPELRAMRGALPTVYITYASLWDVPPAAHLRSLFVEQHKIDRERAHHSPELYAIWDAKPWFTAAVAAANPFRSRFFMWADAGSFRSRPFETWPDPGRVAAALAACGAADCVLLGAVTNRWPAVAVDPAARAPLVGDMIEGGFYAATRAGMAWWAYEFYSLLHEYASRGIFVGKDQTMFNMLAVKFHWRVAMLAAYRSTPACGGNPWFAFQHLVAPPNATGGVCTLAVEAYRGSINVTRGPLPTPPL